MNKKINIIQGIILDIGKTIVIERLNAPDIIKSVLKIETEDNQRLFPEIRGKNKMHILKEIKKQDYVEIGYTFEGSEKNNKIYNNLYIHYIKKLY